MFFFDGSLTRETTQDQGRPYVVAVRQLHYQGVGRVLVFHEGQGLHGGWGGLSKSLNYGDSWDLCMAHIRAMRILTNPPDPHSLHAVVV